MPGPTPANARRVISGLFDYLPRSEFFLAVDTIVPGEFFGEMSLLTGEPRSATIVAVTDVLAHEITKENMNGLLIKRPEVADTVSRVVAERRVLNSQKMTTATAEERRS